MSKKWIRWTLITLGSLVGLLLVAFVILYSLGTAKANQTYDIAVTVSPIPSDVAAIGRGEHIATSFGICTRCHGENLKGMIYFDIPGMLSIPAPNLTKGTGGVGSFYSDEDWVRALRHGIGHDGRALFIMPSPAYHALSAEDLGALIAYLKQVPPVDNELPTRSFATFGRLLMGAGMMPPIAVDPIDHTTPPPAMPAPGATVAYGEYLTRSCTECHGTRLNGMPFGPPGEEVPSPNLTPGGELAKWSEQDFFNTIRNGVNPSGKALNADMPWVYYGRMTDEELQAVWMYLQSLPALPPGE